MNIKPAHFFSLTFFLSWLIWIPLALSHFDIGPIHIKSETSDAVRLLGVLMPAASALILTARSGGRTAIGHLLSRLTLWRVDLKWWLAAVAVQPVLLVVAAFIFNLYTTGPKILPEPVSISAVVVNGIILLIATLGEEIGWRGVALPSLQQDNTAFRSSLILGLLWATWHVPFWLLLDSFDQFGIAYLLLDFMFVLPLTLYITWFVNHGKYSVLLAIMFHLTFNLVNTALLPVTGHIGAYVIFIVLQWIVAILILPHLQTKEGSHMNQRMTRTLIGLILVLGLFLTACSGSGAADAQVPEPDYWPTTGWQSSPPEAQGMDSELLADMLDDVSNNGTRIHSVLVIRNGYIVTEAYFHPYTSDVKIHVQSVTKSVISILVGKAIDDGYIQSENEKLLDFYPDIATENESEQKDSIELEHLLSMSSGLDCQNFPWVAPTMEQSPDWVQFMLDLPVVHEPGTTFGYCNGNSHLVSAILQQKIGSSPREYANRELFKPLGIAPVDEADWWSDPQNITNGGYGLHLRPLDMAKIGLLYLQNGKWDGQQLISATWVDRSTKQYVVKEDGDGYGYLWTVYPQGDHYAALGLGGQQIHVYPQQNLIVVVTASLEGMAGTPEIDHLLESYILPSIRSDEEIAANPQGTSRLAAALETAANPVQPVPALPEAAIENSNQPYTFGENPFGWQLMEFRFEPGASTATVILNEIPLTVGLDNIFRTSQTAEGYEMLLRGRWVDEQTFVVDYPYALGGMMVLGETAESEYRFTFTGNKLEVTAQQLLFDLGPMSAEGTR